MVPEAPLPPGEILEFTFGQVMVGWIEAHGQLYYFGHHDELSLLFVNELYVDSSGQFFIRRVFVSVEGHTRMSSRVHYQKTEVTI